MVLVVVVVAMEVSSSDSCCWDTSFEGVGLVCLREERFLGRCFVTTSETREHKQIIENKVTIMMQTLLSYLGTCCIYVPQHGDS